MAFGDVLCARQDEQAPHAAPHRQDKSAQGRWRGAQSGQGHGAWDSAAARQGEKQKGEQRKKKRPFKDFFDFNLIPSHSSSNVSIFLPQRPLSGHSHSSFKVRMALDAFYLTLLL